MDERHCHTPFYIRKSLFSCNFPQWQTVHICFLGQETARAVKIVRSNTGRTRSQHESPLPKRFGKGNRMFHKSTAKRTPTHGFIDNDILHPHFATCRSNILTHCKHTNDSTIALRQEQMRRWRFHNSCKGFLCKGTRRRRKLRHKAAYSIDKDILNLNDFKNSYTQFHCDKSYSSTFNFTPFDSLCRRSRTVTTNVYSPFISCGSLRNGFDTTFIIFAGFSISTLSPAA